MSFGEDGDRPRAAKGHAGPTKRVKRTIIDIFMKRNFKAHDHGIALHITALLYGDSNLLGVYHSPCLVYVCDR